MAFLQICHAPQTIVPIPVAFSPLNVYIYEELLKLNSNGHLIILLKFIMHQTSQKMDMLNNSGQKSWAMPNAHIIIWYESANLR